ncbi:MAG: serine/threonine protein kinase [Deltaproteobacteria bacterium]|nr:serine/threonine protein kinase [Deltaproteobacteria bacterium]
MQSKAIKTDLKSDQQIAGRYQVQSQIGHDETTRLFRAFDPSNERYVTVKKLYLDGGADERKQRAFRFEHEFYTLIDLVHPAIISVFDYGVDGGAPFYTLESLNEKKLQESAPTPWRQVCSWLCELSSALSLLHAKRFIHCDLTFNDIRFSDDDRLKLISLGKMALPGSRRPLFRVSPFTAPELYHIQNLDARVDLYALGAIAYLLLSGRHAYPARDYRELRDLWRTHPKPPSAFASDIPEELDRLVGSLLALDPMNRPSSAQELVERLSRLADLTIETQRVFPPKHLTTAALVSREEPLVRVRAQMISALRSRGGVLMVQGESGVGLSRFLDACVLEAKIVGAIVARADLRDARGDYGVIRELALQLSRSIPELAISTAHPYIAVLNEIVPELLKGDGRFAPAPTARFNTLLPMATTAPLARSSPTRDHNDRCDTTRRSNNPNSASVNASSDPVARRVRLQSALLDWFLDITSRIMVVIAVDDFRLIDEPSAALLAVLGANSGKQKLVIAVASSSGATASSPRAVMLAEQTGCRIELKRLCEQDAVKLLASLFGDTPDCRELAFRLHNISKGNTKRFLDLAQYLLDQGAVFRRDALWSLANDAASALLADSQKLGPLERLAQLGPDARALIELIALIDSDEITLLDCFDLFEPKEPGRAFLALNGLIEARMVEIDETRCRLASKDWSAPLSDSLSAERKNAIYLALAKRLEERNGSKLSIADFLFRAKQDGRALDFLLAFAHGALAPSPVFCASPAEVKRHRRWLSEAVKRGVALCEQSARPRRDLYLLQKFAFCCFLDDEPFDYSYYAMRALDELSRASGSDLCDSLAEPPVVQENEMQRALLTAQQRYYNTPEAERIALPMNAIKELTILIARAVAYAIGTLNLDLIKLLPPFKPFYSLSPALRAGDQAIKAMVALLEGRYDECVHIYSRYLQQATPEDCVEFEQYARFTRMSLIEILGLFGASVGLPVSQAHLDELEKEPRFQASHWNVRMLINLSLGNQKPAEQCRMQAEQVRIQLGTAVSIVGEGLWPELLAYGSLDDPVGVKRAIDAIAEMARRYRGWVPLHFFAGALYHNIRRDFAAAESDYLKALDLTRPGHHIIWPFAAAFYVKSLSEQERYSEAKEVGRRLLEQSEEAKLGTLSHTIRIALAWAEARSGELATAIERCDAVLRDHKKKKIAGIRLGRIYELRARIAVLEKDETAFQTYANLCARQYKIEDNPTLNARYEKLIEKARAAAFRFSDCMLSAAEISEEDTQTDCFPSIGLLADCHSSRERFEQTLSLLVEQSGAAGGYLYAVQDEGATRVYEISDQAPPPGLDDVVRLSLAFEQDESDDDSEDASIARINPSQIAIQDGIWTAENADRYYILILGHQVRDGYAITAVAALRLPTGKAIKVPWDIAASVSRTLLDSGDVSVIFAA